MVKSVLRICTSAVTLACHFPTSKLNDPDCQDFIDILGLAARMERREVRICGASLSAVESHRHQRRRRL